MHTDTTHHSDTADSSACCPTCEITPFAYTNYWQAKLMLPCDFIDEQRYHIDKMRLHNQRLHGWGVVCGLQVIADTNPACRDRFVTVQPGMAIDCCGHEIVVAEPVRIDFTRLPSYAALTAADAPKARPLQLCIRYRECGIDMIPVLYDDCAWDTDRCAPNKIAETFDFDLLGPDEDPVGDGHTHVVSLGLVRTIRINRATRLAADGDSGRLYIATAPVSGTASFGDLFQLTLGSEAICSAADLEGEVAALGVSPDGDWVYVLRDGNAAAPNAVVDRYDANAIDEAPVNSVPLDHTLGRHAGMAITPLGVVVVLADDNLIALDPLLAPLSHVQNPNTRCIAASLAHECVYVGADAGVVKRVDCTPLPLPQPLVATPMITLTGAAAVLDIAVIPGPPDGGGVPTDDLVALTDAAKVVLVSAGAEVGTVTVDASASQLGAATDGRRAVVAGTAGAQVVNLVSLRSGAAGVRAPFAVGAGITGGGGDVLIGSDTTYVAYPGDAADPGGVAVLGTVGLLDCKDLLWKSSEACESCDNPGCIVLATMLDYDPGDRLVDKRSVAAGSTEVEIDNRLGRRLLPSTSTLTELIECLLNRPGGTGDGIDGVDGDDGADGVGLEKGLVRINAISWFHGGTSSSWIDIDVDEDEPRHGFVIGFTGGVRTVGLDHHIFRVRIDHHKSGDGDPLGEYLRCWCDLQGDVVPVAITDHDDSGRISSAKLLPGAPESDAVAFLVPERAAWLLRDQRIDTLIELHGDFVLDTGKPGIPARAIDAEFVRAEFETGDGPRPSEFGLQGGLFESWFMLSHEFEPGGPIQVNNAVAKEFQRLVGIGRVFGERIANEREAGPFANEVEFQERVGLPKHVWALIRDHLDFTPPKG